MNIQLVKHIIEKIAEKTTAPTLKIVFHGGEPLLLNSEWYEKVFPYIRDICATFRKSVILSMQTNLTLLNNNMLSLLDKYNVIISTSIDGPELVHNSYKGSFRNTAANILKVNKLGLLGGIITVVHFHNYNKVGEIIATLKDLGIKQFLLNFAYSMGKGRNLPTLDFEKRFKVYKDLIDYIIKTQGKEIIEHTAFLRIKRFFNPPKKSELLSNLSCWTPFCHAGIRMLMFKLNGDVYPCGFAGANEYFKLGNIYNNLREDYIREKLMTFHKKDEKYYRECQYCDARTICFFGCPAAEYEDKMFTEENCAFTKVLFNYFLLRRNELEKLLDNEHITI